MRIHALVFYDRKVMEPLDHKIYTEATNRTEKKFIQEFVDFGKKDFLKHMDTTDNEFVISLIGGRFLIYITMIEDIGIALLASHVPEVDNLPHIVSKKLITDYIRTDYIPRSSSEILQWFKHKEIMADLEATKAVLRRSISKVIERGEKIDDLVEKTELLSQSSKIFFKNSRRFNSCCWVFPRPRWV